MSPVEHRTAKPRIERARDLRRRSQDAEWKLWIAIRNRQLGDFKFRRQHPIDRFFADFACVDVLAEIRRACEAARA